MFGCKTQASRISNGEEKIPYRTTVIEGCEYIFGYIEGYRKLGTFMTHKGNCRNSIHKGVQSRGKDIKFRKTYFRTTF